MAQVFVLTLTDEDGETLEQRTIREQYGADALAKSVANLLARFRGEVFAADKVTLTIAREDRPALAELPQADPRDALGWGDA
jgi:hypothetical protein